MTSLLANAVRWFETELQVEEDNGTYNVFVTMSALKRAPLYDKVLFVKFLFEKRSFTDRIRFLCGFGILCANAHSAHTELENSLHSIRVDLVFRHKYDVV